MNAALRLLVILLSVANVAYSQTYTEGPWTYTVDYSNPSAGKVNLTGYSGAGGAVVIPSALGGLPVVSIIGVAYGNNTITSVTIPNSVTSIGDVAFWKCTGLTSVNIPNSVTSIGTGAFQGCTGLTSVSIPNSMTFIGVSAFQGSGLTSLTIPNSVTYIATSAFQDCNSLTSVIIPNSVTFIGEGAFRRCANLTNVAIPSGITSIGSYTFDNCHKLTSVTIPNSVTSIGASAFDSTGLTSLAIPNSVTYIATSAFHNCFSLTSVIIPNSVTFIGEGAFRRCANLTNVVIGSGVTSIGASAFDSTGLTSVNIPNSVTSIGTGAFQGCTGLTSVTIGNGVTSIESNTFQGTGLNRVYFQGNMTALGNFLAGIMPVGTVYYPRGNSTWGASYYGWPTQPYDLPTPQPVLELEHPSGVKLVSGANATPFATSPIGISSPNRVYTLRNTGNAVLSNIVVAKSGPNSADFSLTPPASNSLAAGATTTFSVTFLPASTGARTAQVSISSNDTNSPFIINLSGVGIGENLDTDGDGLNDAAELMMSALGFDWQSNQPTLVSTLFSNANRAQLFTRQDVMASPMTFGLYDSNSIMDLRMGGLMLQKQGGNAVVTFQPQTTGDLTQPFTNHGTPITNTIPMPWNKGFLRIQAR